MLKFLPEKHVLWISLIFFLSYEKKATVGSYRLLLEAYEEPVQIQKSRERWLKHFKNGNFDVKDKERSVQASREYYKIQTWVHYWMKTQLNVKTIGRTIKCDPIHHLQMSIRTGKDSEEREMDFTWIEGKKTIKAKKHRGKFTCKTKKGFLHGVVIYFDNPSVINHG